MEISHTKCKFIEFYDFIYRGTLTLENCEFIHFFHDYTSLVGIEQGYGKVIITDCSFFLNLAIVLLLFGTQKIIQKQTKILKLMKNALDFSSSSGTSINITTTS